MQVGTKRMAGLLVGALLALSGCGFSEMTNAKPTTGRAPTVAEIPSPDETVRGAEDPPIVTLELGSRLHERKLNRSEELPGGIIVPTTNLSAVPLTAALQAVLEGTDVSLSWDTAGSFDDKLVTVTNLSGPLPKVVEKICLSAKVFCSYRNGLLELKEKETFIIELPAVPALNVASASSAGGSSSASGNSMADMIGELAGEKVRIDPQGGNLIYTTDVRGQENIREYLDQLRHGRPLLVMQLYIWEVALNSENSTGINWKNVKFDKFGSLAQSTVLSGGTGFSDIASPGVNLGAKLSGRVDAEGVLKFLATQGQVQTISNPQLTFVSGSNAQFRVGGKQRYISQVGQSSSVSGTSSSSNSSTVSTDSLNTGLTVTIGGAFESGVISAVMQLDMEDVVSLNETDMEDGTKIDLPETTERKVSTSMRVRPGDNLVLAGLVSSRDQNDREGVPLPFGLRLTAYKHDKLKNSEMVILVKPSIVLFADGAPEDPAKKAAAVRAAVTAKPLPDAVVIDKDGPRSFAMPGASGPLAVAPASWEPPARPELMQPAPEAPLSSVPVAPSADGAPVDKRLLQRGFSHAYDEMLGTATPAGGGP